VAGMFGNWPSRIRAERAAGLGLAPDPDIGSVIAAHIAETGRRPGPLREH
jgi:hypothetical protein